MNIWALADLHLALTLPDKDMAFFGPSWKDYTKKMEENWKAVVQDQDLVLIAGDISWAMKLDGAKQDLEWIDALPGKKVLLKGNHDYWWPSNAKLEKVLPPSISFVHNNAFTHQGVSVGGTKLNDHPEIHYNEFVEFRENPRQKIKEKPSDEQVLTAFNKELIKLERSLQCMPTSAEVKIVMTHYPPIDKQGKITDVHSLLKQYNVDICIFGHLHNVKREAFPTLCFDKIPYYLTSADFLNLKPLLVKTL